MTSLQYFIANLMVSELPVFRQRVIDRCCISDQTWRNWKSGMAVCERYHNAINEIALDMKGVKIFQ